MADKRMWMVRAGEGGYAADDFRTKSVVGIGWTEANQDWSQYKSREPILQKIAATFPDNSPTQHLVAASQINRFVNELAIGERVVFYNPSTRIYAVGTIRSAASMDQSILPDFPVHRKVTWDGEVKRDLLTQTTRNSLGAIATLFLIPPDAASEMERLLTSSAAGVVAPVTSDTESVDLLKERQLQAHEAVKDKIDSLGWEAMQELVAGILRAMGYKTRVSPAGADRGKDIVASPDGFGLESPRIVVEVKHRKGQMGASEIRSFLGGRHKDDKGLFVSTGGFTKEARYEADRSQIPLTLMELGDLANAITENYDKLDSETRSLVPLVRVYWPA